MIRINICRKIEAIILLASLGFLPYAAGFPNAQGATSQGVVEHHILSYGYVVSQTPRPPDEYCYHSAGVRLAGSTGDPLADTIAQINQFTDLVGKGLYSYNEMGGLWFSPTEKFWMCETYKPMLDSGLIKALCMSLNPGESYLRTDDNWTVAEIANGQWDSLIRSFALQTKNFGYPLWIRFGGEMNIAQGTASYAGAYSFGMDPAVYVNAWKRLVDLFREEGASNAVFVWNPNWCDIGPSHWTEYYPGDGYVDWVTIDMFQYEPQTDPSMLMSGIYNDYYTNKPIAICEWGANWNRQNYSDADRAAWITKFFDAVEARPQIKLIQYFYTTDFVFDASTHPLTTAAYSNRISDPRYVVEAR